MRSIIISVFTLFFIGNLNAQNNKANYLFTPIRIGSSQNAYSALVSQQNVFSANQDLNLLVLTHRGGPINGTSNQILSTFSVDGGQNWDTTNLVYNGTPNASRYPSGVIFNPIGNSDISNAWSIVAGPALNSSSSFGSDLFAWKKFNNSTQYQYISTHSNAKRICRNNLQTTKNGTFWMTGNAHTDDGAQFTSFNHVLWSGLMTGNNITWTSSIISPNLFLKNSFPCGKLNSTIAFSDNGQIGYFVCLGIPAGSTNYSYRPIVKKTTNGGQNWIDLPDFDFSNIQQIKDIIPPLNSNPNIVLPHFDDIKDAVVDANGDLHFVTFVHGSPSCVYDSIGYMSYFEFIKGYIYDIYTTSSGWNAELISIVYAKTGSYQLGDIDYDERLQMAISSDRTKIFYTWADTDKDLSLSNQYPDLWISGFDVNTKFRTINYNITKNTLYEQKAFLHTTAPEVWKENDTTYSIHNVITQVGTNDILPVNFIYLKGVYVYESDFALSKHIVPVSDSVVGGNGTLVGKANGYNIPTICNVAQGSWLNFNATPSAGYSIKEWKLNDTIVYGNTSSLFYILDVQNPSKITVEFQLIQNQLYNVSFSTVNQSGSISATVAANSIISGSQVSQGSNIIFTAVPDNGYRVKQWKVNSTVVPNNTSNTLLYQNIQNAINVTVEFELISSVLYNLTFEVLGGNGLLSANVDGVTLESGCQIEENKSIIFSAIPDFGFVVKEWKLNTMTVNGNTSTVFAIPSLSQNSYVTVEFKIDDVNVEKNPNFDMKLFPNPFENFFNVISEDSFEMKIYNINGEKILEQSVQIGENLISMAQMTNGIYFVNLLNSRKCYRIKVIKL